MTSQLGLPLNLPEKKYLTPPKDFNEATAWAWLDEVRLKCPNLWSQYQERLRRERSSEPATLLSQLRLVAQLLLAFVSAAGTLDISERILKELVLRLAGQEIAASYHHILNGAFYGPVAIVAAGLCLWKMLTFVRPAKGLINVRSTQEDISNE